jgi:nucleoside-diphosphate-sugar epimerase
VRDLGPFDLLCHHAAEVTNYKSADFDPVRALENNTRNLPAVLSAFRSAGGKGVVLTGTLFEPDEGKGDQSLRAFSPYGLSKGLTWQMFRYYCQSARVPLGKFVMPNPFGPFEEPRFTGYLMRAWKAGQTAQVKTPDYVRDNCHASLLARAYVAFADRAALQSGLALTSPSGYVESQSAFTARVAREVKSRTQWPCAYEVLKQEDFAEPLVRSNKEPVAPAFPQWSEAAAWDEFVQFYQDQA